MKLSNGIARPGVVMEVLENGQIKASAPGLFSDKDDPNLLPPINYFVSEHANAFSSVKQYDNVWIINYIDNPQQLYWLRRDDLSVNKEILQEENIEILCNRETDLDWAAIYFSNSSGWIIKNDNSVIQIRPDGSIKLDTGFPNRMIDINSNSISLGSENTSAQQAVLGNNLLITLNSIVTLFSAISIAAGYNPYTATIKTLIDLNLPNLTNSIQNILSQHVTLD